MVTTNKVVLVHSDSYEGWVFNSTHPTQGRRFSNARNLLLGSTVGDYIDERAPRMATREELALVHADSYVDQVIVDGQSGEWNGERQDLAVLAQTFVGGTLGALDSLLNGETTLAVHLPGAKHHAQYDHSSGFCVFADFAIAAKIAVARGLKVAIFDFDAHHGDGTENLCASDPNILTYSIHENGIFPGTGHHNDPANHVYNKAVTANGTEVLKDSEELVLASIEFTRLASDFGADIIFIAAGADGHRNDPLSNLNYEISVVPKAMNSIRNTFPDTPVLMGGAGGYRPDDDTPEMWVATIQGLMPRG